ncbi:MAG: 4-hydroxy-3-methylbut-2-enyl diphosphate reductase [Candidatus Kapabacteria bacterium]|nr:4-hydroxy-3-methylbut-2-enyl diphosphate reductase [Candidatus Kapabacteria bacterium]MDW7997158.1 4-hydroxy-3-methylbut-2-enyl diphosphate reductase [Bacteroidota bacterium]MDW8225470.1 4-hydroxy-3-methylbut-2-enyl diphosphate reductase [Bacteroidota bacterium]
MQVQVDPHAGFCWGVVRTIQIAEASLQQGLPVYVLGHIIHNPREVERLERLGLHTITHEQLPQAVQDGARVLIRAHGEPPSTYQKAWELGVELIDATCPIVAKLQERVRKFYLQGYQIVIFGKAEHPEMIGVRGVCEDQCVIVRTVEEALRRVDFSRPTVLFSQTTMDKKAFAELASALRQRLQELVVEDPERIVGEFHAKDTICGQVAGREQHLREFAATHDVVVFVAGRASSNGRVLYEVCRSVNPRTYFIESVDELEPCWFADAERVGVTGATSTPQWYMQEVARLIAHRFGRAGT